MWPNIFPVAICSQWIDVFKFLKTDEFYWTWWKIIYWHIFIIFSIPFHDKNKGYAWHFFHFCHKQPNVELVHSLLLEPTVAFDTSVGVWACRLSFMMCEHEDCFDVRECQLLWFWISCFLCNIHFRCDDRELDLFAYEVNVISEFVVATVTALL